MRTEKWSTHFQLARSNQRCYSPTHQFLKLPVVVASDVSGLPSRRDMVQEHLFELSIGQTLQVGLYKVTLLDVDGEDLCVQIDGLDDDGNVTDPLNTDSMHELCSC